MDDSRFDRLTRQVAQQTDRRTMVKTALGGTLAALGLGGLAGQSEARRLQGGFEDDPCASNADCRTGLVCRGARAGLAPTFPLPTGVSLPVITGKEGTCQYKQGCGGKQGDFCRRNDDCCDDLICDNNRCRNRNR